MLAMAVQTFRERWTLFVGTVLSVALGVGLVESSVVVLEAANRLGATLAHRQDADDVVSFVVVSLVVGIFLSVFIIGSTFSFAVTERRRDLALLRLTGASRRQLRTLLLGEAVVVGLLGSLLGVLVGAALVPLQLVSLRRLDMPVDLLELRVLPWMVLVAVGTGVAVSLLGVWVASRRATRVRPLEALRDVGPAARVMTAGRWFWGLSCAGATGVAVGMTQVPGDPLTQIMLSIMVIFTGTVALQQLSPLVVPLVGRTFAVVTHRWAEGQVAQANLVDARRRTATTAGPLIALVGIVLGLYGVVQTQTLAAERDREASTHADLVVVARGADFVRVADVPGVATVAPLVRLPARIGVGEAAEEVSVLATDPAAYRAVMEPRISEGDVASFTDDNVIANGDPDGPVPQTADRLTIRTGHRTVTLEVAARTGISISDATAAVVPLRQVDSELVADAPALLMVDVARGHGVDAVRAALVEMGFDDVESTSAWAVGDQAEVADANRAVTVGLAGLGGVYALLSVLNAVTLAAAARKRELAVAQLAGMLRAQVVRTSVVEALGVAVIGIALGAVAAGMCLAGMRRALGSVLGEPVLVVPWDAFGFIALLSLLAVGLTATAATWVATRPAPISLASARE